MNLDCETDTAIPFMKGENSASERMRNKLNWAKVLKSAEKAANVDRIALNGWGAMCAAFEVKSRQMSLAQLRKFGSYLVTQDKLIALSNVCKGLAIHGYLAVYLMESDAVAYWHVCNKAGEMLIQFESAVTKTQATCNGGEAERENAYLSLDSMNLITEPAR